MIERPGVNIKITTDGDGRLDEVTGTLPGGAVAARFERLGISEAWFRIEGPSGAVDVEVRATTGPDGLPFLLVRHAEEVK